MTHSSFQNIMRIRNNLIENLVNSQKTGSGRLFFLETKEEDAQNFLAEFLSKFANKNITFEHEDICYLDNKINKVKVEQANEIMKFSSTTPWSLEKKFLIIFDGNNLGEIVGNKLLKLFEEPPSYLTIFLQRMPNTKNIQTLESRGIKLRIPRIVEFEGNVEESLTTKIDEFKNLQEQEFLNLLKKTEKLREFQEVILKNLLDKKQNFENITELIHELKRIQMEKPYNGQLTPSKIALQEILNYPN